MRSVLTWILVATSIISVPVAVAQTAAGTSEPPRNAKQDSAGSNDANAAEKAPPQIEGFWPTEKMFQRMFDRMAEGMADHYDFDDEQMLRARESMDKFPKWLQDNKNDIKGLMNEYFEALLDKEAPTPEVVAKWAQKVMPLIKSFDGLVTDITGDMNTYMTDDQRVLLEGEMAGFRMGLGMVSNKLGSWADGAYDPENEWIGTPEQRRIYREQDKLRVEQMKVAKNEKIEELGGTSLNGDRKAMENARNAAKAAKRDANAAGDEWVRYTEDFIKRYQLDDKQTEQARAKLKASIEERDTYKLRIATDLERVDKKLADAKTDTEKKTAKTEGERVRRPLERRFADFKAALDKIPTQKQKNAAALQEAKRDPKSKSDKDASGDAPPKTAANTPGESKPEAAAESKEVKEQKSGEMAATEGAKKEGPSSP